MPALPIIAATLCRYGGRWQPVYAHHFLRLFTITTVISKRPALAIPQCQ